MPETYDVAFYFVEVIRGYLITLEDKNCLKKASKNFLGYRTWVMIYSQKGINKLLDVNEYDNHIDLFFSERDL